MRNSLDDQGQLTPYSVVRAGRNSNSSEILCMSSLPASTKRIQSKATEKRQWELSVSMDTNLPKNVMQPFSRDATNKI